MDREEAPQDEEQVVKQFSTCLEAFGKELKCPVCLGLMDNPYAGACGHPACYECFVHALEATKCCPVCKTTGKKRSLRPSIRFQSFVHAYRCLQPQKVRNNLQTQFSQLIGSTQVFGAMMGKSKSVLDNLDETNTGVHPSNQTTSASATTSMTPCAASVNRQCSEADSGTRSIIRNVVTSANTAATLAADASSSAASGAQSGTSPQDKHTVANSMTPPNKETHKESDSKRKSTGKKRIRRPSDGTTSVNQERSKANSNTRSVQASVGNMPNSTATSAEHTSSAAFEANPPSQDIPNAASTRTARPQRRRKKDSKSKNKSAETTGVRRPLGERNPNVGTEDTPSAKHQGRSRKQQRSMIAWNQNEVTPEYDLPSGQTEEDLTRFLLEEPVVFCCDGLAMEERNQLQGLAEKIGATIQDSWTKDVTHCVVSTVAVNTDGNQAAVEDIQQVAQATAAVRSGRSTRKMHEEQLREDTKQHRFFLVRKRTFKYLMSILSGAWVLGPEWISASSSDTAPTLVGEDPYQVVGDVETAASSLCTAMVENGPRLARSIAVRDKTTPATGILRDRGVVLIGEWQFPAPIEKDIVEMLDYLGAAILRPESRQEDFHNFMKDADERLIEVIVLSDIDNCRLAGFLNEEMKRRRGKPTGEVVQLKLAPLQWLYDTICTFTLVEPSDYTTNVRVSQAARKT